MRFHQMLHAAIASVFVVPAVTLTGSEGGGLERALDETVRAIESLGGLRAEIDATPTGALPSGDVVRRLLSATETPADQEQPGEGRLATLRREVSQLQMVLDELTRVPTRSPGGGEETSAPVAQTPEQAASGTLDVEAPVEAPLTTGLDPETKSELFEIAPPIESPTSASRSPTGKRRVSGLTASPLRLGHAYYRAGRYAEGLNALSALPEDPEALYWSGRCLEQLERYEEAVVTYTKVVDAPDSGYLADRAKSDLAFLSWKLDFAKRIDREGGEK